MAKQATNAVLKPALLLVASLVLLLGAYGFQYIGKMEPCEMCYWQRYPYYIVIVLCVPAIVMAASSPRSRIPNLIMGLCGLCFLAGAGIAAYHAGVEYKWWAGPEGCTASGLVAETAEAFLEALQGREITRCDEIPWSLFGISMAGYNFLISLFLACVSLHFAYDLKARK